MNPSAPAHRQALIGNRLRLAFFLTIAILIAEAGIGWLANSLALLSDAGHILTDVFALGLAWFATRLAERPPDERNTFGYQRSGILAALLNASLLLVITVFVAIEAFMRVRNPQHVAGGLVIFGAFIAILVNSYIAMALRSQRQENLNVRAALLHVLGDLAASVGVIASGVVILVWHAYLADPILSFGIAALIAYGAWTLLRDTVSVLMESAPRGVDLERLRAAMLQVPGVEDVHDLHVWSLSDGLRLLSAHVFVPDQSLADTANLLDDIKMLMQKRFHIEHVTIEPECVDCRLPRRRPIQLHEPRPAADRSR